MRRPPLSAPWADTRGQLAIPALFLIPSLFLFVYLIFETVKLSREKIRHQFALDTAASIEMTNYSNFLNRSAYVNGAFPHRLFHLAFYDTCIATRRTTWGSCGPDGERLYDILYQNGAFPRTDQAPSPPSAPPGIDGDPVWRLRFGGSGAGKNDETPDLGDGRLELVTLSNANDYWISWDDAKDIYMLYFRIYQHLGSLEDAQYSVFRRLTRSHVLFRQSYWLNTDAPLDEARAGAAGFDSYPFEPQPRCIQEIMIYGNKPTNQAFRPYMAWRPDDPILMQPTINNCVDGDGLFQMETINAGQLREMSEAHGTRWPGYPITQHWDGNEKRLNDNYFQVDFHGGDDAPSCMGEGDGPCVHATVALGGGRLWPNPTPKFQTRLFP